MSDSECALCDFGASLRWREMLHASDVKPGPMTRCGEWKNHGRDLVMFEQKLSEPPTVWTLFSFLFILRLC